MTVEISVLGSGKEVGRACVVVRGENGTVMLDCGIHPTASGLEAIPKLNLTDASSISSLVLTHAHLDHSGAIPRLLRLGFKGKVLATLPTAALVGMMWRDQLSIMMKEWTEESRLWDTNDMNRMLARHLHYVAYEEIVQLPNNIKVILHDAGHILGSSIVELEVDNLRIGYSGDLGTSSNHLQYWNASSIRGVDVLICESTYGGVERKGREALERELVNAVKSTLEGGGKVLIPAMSVGKAQEILLALKRHEAKLPDALVVLDGMAYRATKVYSQFIMYMSDRVKRAFIVNGEDPLAWDRLVQPTSLGKRRKLVEGGDPCIFIAPSGMLKGGWSQWYLAKLAPDPRNAVIVCGYTDPQTPASDIVAGAKEVEVLDFVAGERVKVPINCRTYHIEISRHAMHSELCRFIATVKPKVLILVHGEEQNIKKLIDSIGSYAERIETPMNGSVIRVRD
ncbi:MAG: MBL fold metallo-hydrolase [Candidatus Nezhaarchaeota archaeon]|nr:MBL fold metallo-hydrolase [Candidatus Nezhaarchaeota archaeon]MCX8141271.1 MBL fold metallo-hydrolase [Candidatus Nezhaarchaeota archaeon]MDW8049537.1 MBL fold metallo-hydrolase [Nitrososphaerota archaeon]